MGTLREPESLGDRIGVLVELYHGGSVNAAAKDLQVAQQTLARAIERNRSGPRGNVFARLVHFYRCTADWLLTGEGTPPRKVQGEEAKLELAKLRWLDMIDRLDLEPEIADRLLMLPRSTSNVRKVFRKVEESRSTVEVGPPVQKAARLEIEMWSTLIEAALMAPKGKDLVRLLAFAEKEGAVRDADGHESYVDLIFRRPDGEAWGHDVKARTRETRRSS